MKEYEAHGKKGEETLAKLLKGWRDARGFAMKRREVWRERKERYELKGEKNNDGSTHLQKPLTPRNGLLQGQIRHWFDLKETKGKRNKNF